MVGATINGNVARDILEEVVDGDVINIDSSSYPTLPTKDFLVKVKCHGAITTWEATLQGSLDNSTWESTDALSTYINVARLGFNSAQQQTVMVNPQYPYIRVVITNNNGADRGFEIKIVQIS